MIVTSVALASFHRVLTTAPGWLRRGCTSAFLRMITMVPLALVSELLCLSDARSQRWLGGQLRLPRVRPVGPGQGCHLAAFATE